MFWAACVVSPPGSQIPPSATGVTADDRQCKDVGGSRESGSGLSCSLLRDCGIREGTLIELRGIRYAVGVRTAVAMAMCTSALVVGYLALFPLALVPERLVARWFPDVPEHCWTDIQTGGMALVLVAYIGYFLIGAVLGGADKQPVTPTRRALDAPGGWNLELKPLVQSRTARLGLLWAVLLVVNMIVRDHAGTAALILISVVAIAHSVVCVLVSVHMLRESLTRTDGRIDECRNFDWGLFALNDEFRFRARFPDKRWKYPGLIRHHAEAARYARKAHDQRWLSMSLAAVAALLAVLLVNKPVGEFVQVLAAAVVHHPDHVDMTDRDVARSMMGLGLLLIPILLQQRASSLDWLAGLYTDRGKQLREKPPAMMARLAARQPSAGRIGLARIPRAR